MTSNRADQYRIAMCPHCGEELSVVTPAAARGAEGLREALILRSLPVRYLDDDGDGYGGVPFVSLDEAVAALATPTTPEPDPER